MGDQRRQSVASLISQYENKGWEQPLARLVEQCTQRALLATRPICFSGTELKPKVETNPEPLVGDGGPVLATCTSSTGGGTRRRFSLTHAATGASQSEQRKASEVKVGDKSLGPGRAWL